MPNISFASGGDNDTLDFVAYVAKDQHNVRSCFVLECGGGVAQEVITTIGQAFELRFKEFLKRTPVQKPPPLSIPNQQQSVPAPIPRSSIKRPEVEYYNDLPGKSPPEMRSANREITGGMKKNTNKFCFCLSFPFFYFLFPFLFSLLSLLSNFPFISLFFPFSFPFLSLFFLFSFLFFPFSFPFLSLFFPFFLFLFSVPFSFPFFCPLFCPLFCPFFFPLFLSPFSFPFFFSFCCSFFLIFVTLCVFLFFFLFFFQF